MGACIMQRDDPTDDPPKAPEPSDYYAKSKLKAEAKLAELRALTSEGVRALWQSDCESIAKSNAESVAKAKETERRYARMRAMVEAWKPPTVDHEGLRQFMLQQIDICKIDWTPYTVEAPATPGDWLSKQLESAEWSLKYAIEQGGDEVKRTNERRDWITALYASLPEGA
jgi:hypothetical protein